LDVVFLIDCSGSMCGSSIALAREAINYLLHSLPANVYFNIICFGSRYTKLFKKSKQYSDDTLGQAKAAMAKLDANLGGTEILTPLTEILEEKTELPRRIFILTDGSVSNSLECIKKTQKNNKKNRVFTLGIGSAADRHLVKGLARAGLGTAEFTVEGEKMAPKILKQLKNCLQPSLQNVKIDWGDDIVPGTVCQVPDPLPPLYNGHRLQIFRIFEKESRLPTKVRITAEIPSSDDYEETVKVETKPMNDNLLHKMYARKLIQGVTENFDEREESEVKSIVTEVSLKYQLMSRFTSFIAVDTRENKSEKEMEKRIVASQVPRGFGFGSMMNCAAPQMARCRSAAPMMMMCNAVPRSGATREKKRSKNRQLFGGLSSGLFGGGHSFMKKNSAASLERSVDQDEDCDMGSSLFDTEFCSASPKEDTLAAKSANVDPVSQVLRLVSLQSADGTFKKDPCIFSISGLSEQQLEDVRGGSSLQVFYTLFVVLILEHRFQEAKDCWEMVVEKSRGWLNNQQIDANMEEDLIKLIKTK